MRQTGELWRGSRVTLPSLVSSRPDGGAVERRQCGETLRAQRRQGEQVAAAGELRSVRTNCQRRQPGQEVMWPVGGAILQGHSCISPRGFLISPPLLCVAHLKLVGFVPSGGKWKAKIFRDCCSSCERNEQLPLRGMFLILSGAAGRCDGQPVVEKHGGKLRIPMICFAFWVSLKLVWLECPVLCGGRTASTGSNGNKTIH